MKEYESLIREHCEGQEWDEVLPEVQAEITAQYLRDEGFDPCMAGVSESQFLAVFTVRLADVIAARYVDDKGAAYREACKSFACAAHAVVTREIEKLVSVEWNDYCSDWLAENTPDVDAYAEQQARHRDFVALS